MSHGTALFIVLLIASSTYAAGRLHGKVGYRFGYRFGYRQGYFDGDRAGWNRRRRDAQAAISTVLSGKHGRARADTFSLIQGTTYTSSTATGRHALDRRGTAS
ncbi:MAG TPA: hypothetical protein VJT31_09055 [Rugosimonospora sp.]|nr:hypothetical protein [Rugosimonospora sp.]